MSSLKKMLLVGFAMLMMSMASIGQVAISVRFGPPALPVYEQPLCPGDGYIWTPGYWAWDGDDYYWVPGTWVLAPEVGFLWTPPWWGWDGGVFLFHEGWWGPQVGFYGGIDYGFGYFGSGFVGGRWDRGRFFYNRSVTNINVVNIHNVYNETVVNRTVNRVSYNGGQGGIEARASSAQEAAFREHHVGPVALQTRHVEEARGNRDLRANVNHGRPGVAATARPADFKHDAMPAREAGGAFNENRGNENRGGNPSEPRNFSHAKEVPPMERPAAPNTGNAKLDQKYQKQQDKMFAQQQKERQKVEQQQEREHQQMAKRTNDAARQQQMEQRHQQQTQQMVQRHTNQAQALQSRQAPAPHAAPAQHEAPPHR